MKGKVTPLTRQYNQIKQKYPGTILLFRLGDFFETFNEDAVLTAKACGITLTKRNNGAAGDMPLAGFPHHQLDAYLPKLVKAGHRVAVCEQLEDPKKARGIVRRGVTEVVTPGIALYDKLLDTKKNNYICAIVFRQEKNTLRSVGLACSDVSTGEFFTGEFPARQLLEVLESLAPNELLISKAQKKDVLEELEMLSIEPAMTRLEEWIFEEEFGREQLLRHFNTKSLKGFGIDKFTTGLAASGAILHYISETQKGRLPHIKNISVYDPSDFMALDYATRRNLEITFSYSDGTKDGSLISILDKTVTAMGGRLFKKWITQPLRNLGYIHKRLESVRALFNNQDELLLLRKLFTDLCDLERVISKVCTNRANPRDVVALCSSLKKIPAIREVATSLKTGTLESIALKLQPLSNLSNLIDSALKEEPTANLGTGNVFNEGYSDKLDTYVEAKYSGKNWIAGYREEQRQKTGIPSLKIGYNNVFGYYIDVTRIHSNKVPDEYQRKQTLTNSERYTTPELKEIETKILNAEENIAGLEQSLFAELLGKIAEETEDIQRNAFLLASLDCLMSFAYASRQYDYCEPEIDESDIIDIAGGRHPVVERLLEAGQSYTPNSTKLDSIGEQIHIITGPNMSGKSCYLRQTALIILLGQIGCYVPAKSAHFGLIDRIFTRVGAQDNITAGESTFLVEMQEAANILNNATSKSLILLDEVGRGTATFDGISIAWSIAEFLHNTIGAKTLFATHYHELNNLAERYPKIANYMVEVIETSGKVIFSHKVRSGASDHSFGIHVAKMAGLPYDVVQRADDIMKSLEGNNPDSGSEIPSSKPNVDIIETKKHRKQTDQLAIFEFRDDFLRDRIKEININNLTPIQALQILSEMHKEANSKGD